MGRKCFINKSNNKQKNMKKWNRELHIANTHVCPIYSYGSCWQGPDMTEELMTVTEMSKWQEAEKEARATKSPYTKISPYNGQNSWYFHTFLVMTPHISYIGSFAHSL